MKRPSTRMAATLRKGLALMAGSLMTASALQAQVAQPTAGPWRVGASTGGYVAPSSLIRTTDGSDTELTAGPAFGLEAQYVATGPVAVYGAGTLAFGTVRLGSSIQPAVAGPSDQVVVGVGTAGVVLTGTDWLGSHVEPTLRLGGGLKWYRFDLTGADSQVRPTADIGLGLRGRASGLIEGLAEVRYLLSSFDQEKLPTRGIAPQEQRQHDFVFSIGIGIRP